MELGQPVLAKYWGAVVAGVAPRIMGISPTVVILRSCYPSSTWKKMTGIYMR